MGYNTVVFMLNDFMHKVRKSPYATTHLITHPPITNHPDYLKWDRNILRKHAENIATEHNEEVLHPQAIEVLPTFHASDHKFFGAGGNCIEELKLVKYGKTKDGKLTVTLELPEWWSGHPSNRRK